MARVSTVQERKASTSETLEARRRLRKARELERETLRRDAELRLREIKRGR